MRTANVNAVVVRTPRGERWYGYCGDIDIAAITAVQIGDSCLHCGPVVVAINTDAGDREVVYSTHVAIDEQCRARGRGTHDLDLTTRGCRRCHLTFEVIDAVAAALEAGRLCTQAITAEHLAPSDLGLVGVLPLPEPTWSTAAAEAIPDTEWSEQNRKINDLLSGRTA